MNKSKFLKKSLAMLLALMLVVAMIPLSASAALPDDLEFIYVDGNQVYVEDGEETTVEVNNNVDGKPATQVAIRTNEDLEDHDYELRAVQVDSEHELDLSNVDTPVSFADYLSADGKITLRLYDTSKKTPEVRATYTLDIELVEANTTTNIASIEKGNGVYSVEWDNEEKVVNVVLARYTDCSATGNYPTVDWTQTMQNRYAAKMTITPADEATMGNPEVSANNGATFTITSQSGGNSSTYKVVATYLDALNSFSVTGTDEVEYFGEFTDKNKDGVDDTITVVLPNSAIYNKWDEEITSPELVVKYAPQGNVTALNTVVNGNHGVRSGATVKFDNLGTAEIVRGAIDVYRLPAQETAGVLQHYNLIVKLQPSNNTDITYAQVNNTEAVVDKDAKTIVAEVPSADKIGGTDGADVIIRTDANAHQVTIDSKTVVDVGGKKEVKATYTEWTFYNIDLRTSKIVTVTAEDGTLKQYTISANKVENATDAAITAFYIGDYQGNVTAGEDDIYVTVPYMTINVAKLPIYVTPTSYSYVTLADGKTQIVNGTTTAAELGLNQNLLVGGERTAKIIAYNKNDTGISEEYTIHVVLDEDNIATGNELTDLEFTAQSVTNDSDTDIVRAMTDENTFNMEVNQRTPGSTNVQTLNLPIPVSFTKSDLGITFHNVVTNFNTRENGVAFGVINAGASGDYNVTLLTATQDEGDDLTGKVIASQKGANSDGKVFDTIIVAPQEVARRVLADTAYGTTGGYLSKADAAYCTIYDVEITATNARSDADLNSMSVKDFDLQINDDFTISGELPFSLTTEDITLNTTGATFVEFDVSDYAVLADASNVYYFSNGDRDGDGETDASDDSQSPRYFYNYKLIFKRNLDPDQTVSVYRASVDANGKITAVSATPIDSVTVLAEDRLNNNGKVSSQKYTFKLTWAAPCEDADIETFTLGGYEGHINNDPEEGRTITVNVPYGTSVTGMTAEFSTSTGATVKVGSTSGMSFESGVTSLNYTNPVKLYVTSEDKDTTRMYTVTVKQGYTFEDIDEDDWFYDDVVAAAEEGYINGMEPGKYEPLGKLTRAQFATMIARAMNYDSNPDVEASFPDVKDDHYAKAAINFCYENDIIRGYEDGTFKPEKTISRQEVAAILARAFNLEEISSKAYPDDSQIAGWASDDVYKCLAAELMMGDADTGNFRPVSDLTRAEAATILMNANRAGFID